MNRLLSRGMNFYYYWLLKNAKRHIVEAFPLGNNMLNFKKLNKRI
jgi:hypothetical protein